MFVDWWYFVDARCETIAQVAIIRYQHSCHHGSPDAARDEGICDSFWPQLEYIAQGFIMLVKCRHAQSHDIHTMHQITAVPSECVDAQAHQGLDR